MKIAIALGGLVASAIGFGLSAWPDGCTSTPPRHWLTPLEVESRLRESGMKMQSLRADDDRCFVVVARDKFGSLRTVVVNPADGAVIRNEVIQ